MTAKEFLEEYGINDVDVFSRNDEHHYLYDLMEEYAKQVVKNIAVLDDVSNKYDCQYCKDTKFLQNEPGVIHTCSFCC